MATTGSESGRDAGLPARSGGFAVPGESAINASRCDLPDLGNAFNCQMLFVLHHESKTITSCRSLHRGPGVCYRTSDAKGQAEEQRDTQRAGAPTATFRIVDTNIDMDVILRHEAQSCNDA